MDNIRRYNIFILLSTLARNIVEVFSSVILYKMGYTLKEILLFFALLYLVGAITSTVTIYLTKIVKPKYLLIISSIIFSSSFYFMSSMNNTILNLILFSLLYSLGSYSYHTLRHYYAIKSLDNHTNKEIGSILIFSNLALAISSLIGSYIQSKFSLFALALFVVFLSLIALIPIFKLSDKKDSTPIKYEKIPRNKFLFFLFEQAKVINLSLQPLYLYFFVDSKIEYIGAFNVIMGLSSCLFIYFFVRKINDCKYFKYLNIIFCIILLLKLNITSKYPILIIGFFEGLGVKMFELISTENIYNISPNINIKGYLITTEVIFCLTRSIMCLIGHFINNIVIILYLSIIPILITGFIKRTSVK